MRAQSLKKALASALGAALAPAADFLARREKDPAAFWQACLFASFWISVAFFPIGYGFREVSPLVCALFLVGYYRHGWRESALRNLRVWPLFLFGLAMIIIGVVFSIRPLDSLLVAGTGLNKGYLLPFVAMECAKSRRQICRLVWAFVLACFWEGLDGVWQICVGQDFVMGYAPNAGRLTGSLGDYTVGNYLALALIPAFAVWLQLREREGYPAALLIFIALFWPAFALLCGASSRSSILAVAGAVFLWQALSRGLFSIRAYLYPALVMGAFAVCQPGRLAVSAALGDNRWDLWRLAWRVFERHPFFGAGAGQYNAAFREMGLAPEREVITISHPHSLYLDMLYAHGAAGFACGMIFVGGFLIWGAAKIFPRLRAPKNEAGRLYWATVAWFWLGYAGWLINGIFGHDFYRIWWLAEAMCSLGITIGAIELGLKEDY